MVTDEMVEKALNAALKADIIPADDPKHSGVRIDEYLSYTPAEAVELGVQLTQKTEDGKPRWHGFTDIMGDEYDDTNRAILRPVIRAALEAAMSVSEPIAWESTTPGYIKFVTDTRYRKFRDEVKKWYKPFHCSSCTAAQVQDVAAWHPIETAPKDGRTILAYFPLEGLGDSWERVMPVKYRESMMPEPWIFAGRAASSYSAGPTHWMPLPFAPVSLAKQERSHD